MFLEEGVKMCKSLAQCFIDVYKVVFVLSRVVFIHRTDRLLYRYPAGGSPQVLRSELKKPRLKVFYKVLNNHRLGKEVELSPMIGRTIKSLRGPDAPFPAISSREAELLHLCHQIQP